VMFVVYNHKMVHQMIVFEKEEEYLIDDVIELFPMMEMKQKESVVRHC